MVRKLAFALAAVSLLVAALVMLRQNDESTARTKRAEARLPMFDDRRVTGLVLEAGSATWRLVLAPSGWRITAPVEDVADPRAVEALIAAARRAPIVQTLETPDALSTYGLEPPIARLTLSGITTPSLELGRITPTGEAVFARLAGRPEVLLLGLPDATPLAETDPAALRDRSLVDLARSELQGLVIAPSGLKLARGDDGWWITAPRRLPASPAAVDKLLGALYGAKVVGWDDLGDPSDAKYGLGAGASRVTFRSSNSLQTITLGAQAGDGNRFALSEGRTTILILKLLPPLSIPSDLNELRETQLTNVNRYDVKRASSTPRAARAFRLRARTTRPGSRRPETRFPPSASPRSSSRCLERRPSLGRRGSSRLLRRPRSRTKRTRAGQPGAWRLRGRARRGTRYRGWFSDLPTPSSEKVSTPSTDAATASTTLILSR